MKTMLLLSVFALAGVAHAEAHKAKAAGTIEAKSGSKLAGTVSFTIDKSKVTVKIDVSGASPGDHAVHLHEKGDCSDLEGKNAGGHWNPTTTMHGK